jgi:hypothetical protein
MARLAVLAALLVPACGVAEIMIPLLRWLTRSDYAVGALHLSPQQIAEAERWTKAQQDGAIVRHARRDHRQFWAAVDAKRAEPHRVLPFDQVRRSR